MRERPSAEREVDLAAVPARIIFYTVIAASMYLLFAGHNRPGGGFVGALVAGGAIAVRYIAGGISDVRRVARVRPWTALGIGLLVAAVTATTPLVFGRAILYAAVWETNLPVVGEIAVSSVLAFDIGVYLVVIGVVLMVFEAFGDDLADPAPVAAAPSMTTPGTAGQSPGEVAP